MGIEKDEKLLKTAADLRSRAEKQLKSKKAAPGAPQKDAETLRLLHELQVHQIELEMQNVELRQARDKMEVELGRYADLYDFAPVGYVTLNRQGTVLSANFTLADLFRIEHSKLLGRRFGLLLPAEARQRFAEFLVSVFASQARESCEVLLTVGRESLFFIQIDAVSAEDGQTCRVAVSDISARLKATTELQQLQMRLEWILDKTSVGTWMNALPLGRLNWDAQTRKLCFLGPEDEPTIELFWSRVHPDDRERTRLAVEGAIRDHSLYEIDFRVVEPETGKMRWIHSAGQATYDSDGTPLHFDGINYDISARVLAEQAVRELEELNRTTLKSLPMNIAVIDRRGRIIAVNQAWTDFAKTNGNSRMTQVAVGANYVKVCRQALANKDEDPDAVRSLEGIEAVLAGKVEQFTMEYPCHSPQQQRWFLMTVTPYGSSGEGGAVITHLDITTRIQGEIKLKKLYEGMELMVLERTVALSKANEQLIHEIDERKKAEESLHVSFAEVERLKELLQAENIYLQREVGKQFNFGEIIGQSKNLAAVFVRIQQVAPMNATVLLLGETGTGKGVVARAIHSRSARKNRAMITVNCTALPANLIESELFGRERGAFTGASERQIGRFELADGGTIFLDEIGEMPMELQCKLLRVIQDGEFERLGSPRTIKVDVRIIAATNRNLEEEIKSGRFREDLFYRLNVFPITIPPLRQRTDDIPLLVDHFVAKFNRKNSKRIEIVTKDTLSALQAYYWPGNVRELESIIERAVIISQGTTLQVLDFFEANIKPVEASGQTVKPLIEMEHDHITQALQSTNWRIDGKKGAALILGLNPSTLRARMRKYGIVR